MSTRLVERFARFFASSAIAVLLVSGAAKVFSGLGNAGVLQSFDPIFGVTFKNLFLFVGIAEITTAVMLLFMKRLVAEVAIVCWLSILFLTYRIGVAVLGYKQSCGCLGHISDALHVRPETADRAMEFVLAYLLLGSWATLIGMMRHRRQQSVDVVIETRNSDL